MARMRSAGKSGTVLARLTKDMTLRTVSTYNFLERSCGGGCFSDRGGRGGGALGAVQGAQAADALGAGQAETGAVEALGGAWATLSAEPQMVSGVLGDSLVTYMHILKRRVPALGSSLWGKVSRLPREGAGEEGAGPAKEGPAWGPWGVSSTAAEVRFFFPDALVGVTGSAWLVGTKAVERDWVGNGILLSPLPVLKRSISSLSSSPLGGSSSQGPDSN
jgi:hypothetical protein